MEGINDNVRNWYKEDNPEDPMYRDIPFWAVFRHVAQYLSKGKNVYDICGNDSFIRERVFDRMTQILGIDYDCPYYMWMYGGADVAKEHAKSDFEEKDPEHYAEVVRGIDIIEEVAAMKPQKQK